MVQVCLECSFDGMKSRNTEIGKIGVAKNLKQRIIHHFFLRIIPLHWPEEATVE